MIEDRMPRSDGGITHFNLAFKRRFGETPSALRER